MGKWRAPPKDHMLSGASGGEIILFKAFFRERISFADFQIILVSASLLWIDYEPSDPKRGAPHIHLCVSLRNVPWHLPINQSFLVLLGQVSAK